MDCKEVQKNNRLADLKTLYKRRQATEKENDMAAKKKSGTCAMCGRSNMRLIRNHGIDVCSTCSSAQVRIKNEPEKIIAEIKRMHGDKYLPGAEVESTAELKVLADIRSALEIDEKPMLSDLAEIAGHKVADIKVLTERNKLQAEQCDKLVERNEQLFAQNEDLATQLREQEDRVTALEEDNNRLMDENMELMENKGAAVELKTAEADVVPVARLLSDSHLLAAVNTLANTLREVA